MHPLFWLSASFIFLIIGADLLVRGSSRLALTLGMSPLLIGLTVVSFGTSAPEFAISIFSVAKGQTDLAFGNIVGSNIFNVLFVLGAAALVFPLRVTAKLVRIDVPIMVGVTILVVALSLDNKISHIDSSILIGLLGIYLGLSIRIAKQDSAVIKQPIDEAKPAKQKRSVWRDLVLILLGLVLLTVGSQWLVASATTLAKNLGISELIIGLTIVAAGTSVPEVATSILASIRKEPDIAVGNVVGSCIFNILAVQ